MEASQKNNYAHVRKHRFRILYAERSIFLLIGDLVMINFALLINYYVVSLQKNALPELQAQFPWFIVLSFLWIVTRISMDADDLNQALHPADSAWVAAKTALITSVIFYLIPFIPPGLPRRRVELFLFPSFAVVGLVFWRMLYAVLLAKPFLFQRVLIIGAGQAGQTMLNTITSMGYNQKPGVGNGFHVVGFVDDNPSLHGKEVEKVPILGGSHDLSRIIWEYEIDKLILAITHQHTISHDLMQTIYSCREVGVPITTMTDLYERITGRVPVEHAGSNLPVLMPISTSAHHRVFLLCKRMIDIIAGLIGCLITGLITPFVWLIYRFPDGGPVFCTETYAGQWRHPIQLYCFRTRHNSSNNTSQPSNRYTNIGFLFAVTKLEKFPIFLHVLKGYMSLVGPRPIPLEISSKLAKESPISLIRYSVKPGIIGWSQVRHRNIVGTENQMISLQYDLYYLKNEGLFLETFIFLKTLQRWLGLKLY